MENTRHERAIIILASYIIGFTSSFIAFGAYSNSGDVVAVATSPEPTAVTDVTEVSVAVPEASIFVNEIGLHLVTEAYERLLTVNAGSPLAASAVTAFADEPGVAERLVEAELSRDSKYVYFCEQRDADIDECNPYIYSIATDMIYPVTLDGEVYTSTASGHVSAWSPIGHLSVNDNLSISEDAPWELTALSAGLVD